MFQKGALKVLKIKKTNECTSTQYQSERASVISYKTIQLISKFPKQDVSVMIFDNMLPCILFCQTLNDEGLAVSQDTFPSDAVRTLYDD